MTYARRATAHERYLYGDWTLAVDLASSAPMTIVRVRRDDRGRAVYVEPKTETETEEPPTVTTTADPTNIVVDVDDLDAAASESPAVRTGPPPLRLTLAGLRELDACGDYLRVFGRIFPESQFPDGAELTEDVCRRYPRDFDWAWAAQVMLTPLGQAEHRRLCDSRARANRERFGDAATRRASVFGHLFDTQPGYRSEAALRAVRAPQERADERALAVLGRGRRDVQHAERCLTDARQQTAHWERELAARRAALPPLVEAAAGAEARRAAYAVESAAADVARAEATLVVTRERLATARSQAEQLRAASPEPEPEPEPSATPVTPVTLDTVPKLLEPPGEPEPASSTGSDRRHIAF